MSRWAAVGGCLALAVALAGAPALAAAQDDNAPESGPEDVEGDVSEEDLIESGRELYLTSCVSCHGVDGVGSDRAPSLVNDGAAGADFMLRTGRMPLADPTNQAPSKPPAYTDDEIRRLVAYVASLGDGPEIPDVDVASGDLARGGELFRANCAACHNASGVGGALSYGDHAPSLMSVEPLQIGEAMRFGPGEMPVFGEDILDDQDMNDIVRYVRYLQDPEDPGGLSLGRVGPVPEGFVAWLFGLGALIFVVRWITMDQRRRRAATADADEGGT